MTNPNFERRNPEIEKLLNDIGHRIGSQMPPGFGFTLMIFTYGEGGDLFYISSAQREDMVKMFREAISKLQA